MPMAPFHGAFPDLAERETRSVRVSGYPGLPDGTYLFLESYCNEADCDCRRVMINVVAETDPSRILAAINYGWESVAFYAKMVGLEMAPEAQGPILDPLNDQSPSAPALQEIFRDVILDDTAYVERLKRHYAMFKKRVCGFDTPGLKAVAGTAAPEADAPFPGDSPHRALLETYSRLRSVLLTMHDEVFARMSKRGVRQAAEEIGLWRDHTLCFEAQSDMDVFLDYCLYQHLHRRLNGMQRHVGSRSGFGSSGDQALLAESMMRARYRVLEVESTEPGVGVAAKDVLRGEKLFVMDRGFGSTACRDMFLAGTILTLPEFSMTTGGAIPLGDGWQEVVRQVCGAGAERGQAELDRAMEARLALAMIRRALSEGWAEGVEYA